MYNTEIGKFCAEHGNWEELLVQEPYCLKIKEDGNYVMFSYDQIRSDFSNSIVRECRGIIFRKGQWDYPVCYPFTKFFNYGEPNAADIDWETAWVTEKIDGSLIKLWWDGTWHISTNGTIDAFKAEIGDVNISNFGDYFLLALSRYYNSFGALTAGLFTDHTYMFELVGPYNRVVVPYDEPDLFLLGIRNSHTGHDLRCNKLTAAGFGLAKFKVPTQYSLASLEDCIKAAELRSWDDEGFVVTDLKGNRIKIKSPAYILAHYTRNNNVITRKHLIRTILANEAEEFLCYAADYKEELKKVQRLINAYYQLGDQIVMSCQQLSDIPKKTYAAWVQTLPKIYHGLAFKNYNNVMSVKEYTAAWNETKWEEYLNSFEKLCADYTL